MKRWSDEEYERRAQERFWAKVDKSGGPDACWPWTAAVDGGSYGQFWHKGRQVLAHRFALGVPDPTPGLETCHSCGNRLCCNPAHLSLGTAEQNGQDRIRHGTAARGEANGGAKLSREQAMDIRRRVRLHLADRKVQGFSQVRRGFMASLVREFGVGRHQILGIAEGKYWKEETSNG